MKLNLKKKKKKPYTISKLKSRAQVLVNKFVKERDKLIDENGNEYWICISCGKKTVNPNSGHYIPISVADHLRYNLDNISSQCITCNRFKEGYSVGYRVNLIKKISESNVILLEEQCLSSDITKLTLHDVLKIIKRFRKS